MTNIATNTAQISTFYGTNITGISKFLAHLSPTYRTSTAHQHCYSVEHGSAHISKICRTTIEHISKICRTYVEHLSKYIDNVFNNVRKQINKSNTSRQRGGNLSMLLMKSYLSLARVAVQTVAAHETRFVASKG